MTFPVNHSPYFDIDEDALELGVSSLSQVVIDYVLNNNVAEIQV
jgi:metal-dependent amidase/aminoacylase/carboxypeptidase family protein